MKIYELIIEPDREEQIARHHVTVDEVEEVVLGDYFVGRTRQGRFRIIGQTDAGRYLMIIVAPRKHGGYGLVTARDADEAERRLYNQRRRH